MKEKNNQPETPSAAAEAGANIDIDREHILLGRAPGQIFVYSLPPIDCWWGWMTESELFAQMHRQWAGCRLSEAIRNYFEYLICGQKLALKLGWEGTADEFRVAGLPVPEKDDRFLIGWKQGYDHTTFIVSPVRLRWIENVDHHKMIQTEHDKEGIPF